MSTLSDANNLARALLAEWEATAEVYTDENLVEFGKAVYREIQRRFAVAGHPLLEEYVLFDITAGVTSISDGSGSYPAAGVVIAPKILWEGAQGSTLLSAFVQMEEAFPYLIPRAQTAVLTHWEWKNKVIYFIGSSATRTVRMLYAKYLTDLVDQTSNLLIPNSVDAMAYGIAAAAARARGAQAVSKDAETIFDSIVTGMIGTDAGRMVGA